ncbi:helix-turn-helix domain-containing protein [Catenuloplanes atrovinosus]|uniref:DNA-binding transcriptional LysR family regulator n=1 Tax=Catenuloplanes atrovinosus TaxID=137266 RepID=A0AAE3YP19_9ACTN|nr:LysR family transcriptional regulator [Catenuloplanes atrovinosus]MDR7275649.1 DNA-binding transcriptional LysR family regulator [Catenuloplanes atrovinosus]
MPPRSANIASEPSAVAEAIGVPQPTATRWIAVLSGTVGVPLTRRSGTRGD